MMMRSALVVACVAIAAACSDAAEPAPSLLAGLTQIVVSDTTCCPPMPDEPPAPPGRGAFHGVVLGYTPGTDTVDSAVMLSGVVVSAHVRQSVAPDGVGPLAASVMTAANGAFQLPEMPGGEYVVTFLPPAGSQYRGAWAVAEANALSNDGAWWIMLPRK